jgi:hypothetical protein
VAGRDTPHWNREKPAFAGFWPKQGSEITGAELSAVSIVGMNLHRHNCGNYSLGALWISEEANLL